jgi:hypothetical protein
MVQAAGSSYTRPLMEGHWTSRSIYFVVRGSYERGKVGVWG